MAEDCAYVVSSNILASQSGSAAAPKKPKLERLVGSKRKPTGSLNIAVHLRNAQTMGSCKRRLEELPEGFVQSYQSRFVNVDGMPLDLYKLCRMVKDGKADLRSETFNNLIESIHDLILVDAKAQTAALEFFYSGGVELFVDIIVDNFYDLSDDICKHTAVKTIEPEDIKVVQCMLQILFMSAQAAPIGLSFLCNRKKLFHFLFSLLAEDNKKIYTDATVFLEEILLSDPKGAWINVKEIACLPALLEMDQPPQQESLLYHILSTVISVNDAVRTVGSSLQEHDQWMMSNSRAQMNRENQEHLLSFPRFLERLFRLCCSRNLSSHFQQASIQRFLSLFNVDETDEGNLLELFSRVMVERPDITLQQISLYSEKTARADAFLLLSLLLTGKCRDQLQQSVLQHNLVQGLESAVQTTVWESLNADVFPDYLYGGHDGGPEATVKIQYLRLIYSISDHHLHRYLLLNREELGELENIAVTHKAKLDANFVSLDRSKCCLKKPGLLVQIIEKIKLESSQSYVRFWMTRALESFLRGRPSLIDQNFLMKKGLLEELFRVLLSDERPSSEVIQGHFDLLSSLMKDNIHAFEKFSAVVNCAMMFQKLCRMIDGNFVDSNMFVRCIVLTIHHFQSVETQHVGFIQSCDILQLYSSMTKQVQAIFSLIGLLTVKKLSQENVSCLNTSIIILLIAKLNGQLPKYLSTVLTHTQDGMHSGREILENLRELLIFWLEHYGYPLKASDVKSLEESTGFEFHMWKSLTMDLISADRTSSVSIQHYLPPPPMTLKATLVPSCTRTS